MAQNKNKSIISYLIRLMKYIFKWFAEPNKQSNSWKNSIDDSRDKIKKIQKKKPSLNDDYLKKNWEKAQEKAKQQAEKEMKKKSDIDNLTWKQVFDDDYEIDK